MPVAADPQYPIGRFQPPDVISPAQRNSAILSLAEMPELLRESVRKLTQEQMNTPYRDGGWTVRQVVHHVADSHSTALFRVKKALTEDWPTVPGYSEKDFAMLPDVAAPAEWSLELIESVHARWVMLLQALEEPQWKRGFIHAERGRQSLDFVTLHYSWHSRHHVAHINHLRVQQGW